MRIFGWTMLGIGTLLVLSVVGTALNIVTIPWLTLNNKVQAERGIVTQTFSAQNELYNYHWFKERSAALLALDATIVQSKAAKAQFESDAGPRTSWTFEDKTEDGRLAQVVLGQQAQYNSLAGEYDARAKEVDRSVFQDELPLFFPLK